MRPIRRRPSDLSNKVAARIRRAILQADLAPGTRVRQEALAERLGVSRAPVREALLLLAGEGLIELHRGRGAIVSTVDVDLIRDLYGFREGIDRHVAETLARRTDLRWSDVKAIVAEGTRTAASRDTGALIELDLRFHTALYAATGNRILIDVMHGQWMNMRRVMGAILNVAGYPKQIWEEHGAILDAIAAHEPERAGQLAAAHTAAAKARLVENAARIDANVSPAATKDARTRRRNGSRP